MRNHSIMNNLMIQNTDNLPFFIAEVSSNHDQNLQRAKEFIKIAFKIGCHGVKFQLFKTNRFFTPEILAKSKLHRKRKEIL